VTFSHNNRFLAIPALLLLAGSALAQTTPTQTTPVVATGVTATMHGVVADPTGAVIPGTSLTLTTAQGKAVGTTKSDGAGHYSFPGIAADNYIISAETTGFAAFRSQPIAIAAGQSRRVNITLAIEESKQVMVVSDDSPQISLASDQNASALVIKGKDLDALSDDPDELSNELQALAGPAAGPNGGQIYIDGFTGGQLPPKSSIREIRINQNPYSAEFDKLGYGRIEILTKPGTDKLHGQFQMMGNTKGLNTGNPYVSTGVPDYYSDQINGNVSGAITKNSSFNFHVEYRNIQSANPYVLYSIPGYADASYSGALFNPNNRWNIGPRFDVQLGAKNTLTTSYQWTHQETSGNLGSSSLPTLATSNSYTEHAVQIIDTEVITDKIVNETRFQFRRYMSNNQATPQAIPAALATYLPSVTATSPTIYVSGSFNAGASASQFSSDSQDNFELQNIATIAAGKHALKFGTRLRDSREANSGTAGYNGSFIFNSPTVYQSAQSLLSNGFASGITAGNGATQLTYSYGKPGVLANVFDGALFVQDEWKVSPVLTLSPGFRFETQNHIPDQANFGPRLSLAWALDGSAKKQAKTVFRAGFGLFYDRTGNGDLLNTERYLSSGTGTESVTIKNPTCFSSIGFSSLTPTQIEDCGITSTPPPTYYRIAKGYRSQDNEQLGLSIERQLAKTSTLSITYLRTYGIHENSLENVNTPRPNSATVLDPPAPNQNYNIIDEYNSEGFYHQSQLIANVRTQFGQNFNLSGYYQFDHARGDINGTPSNPYNFKQDFGRSGFNMANLAVVVANWTGPWGIRLSNFLFTHSGTPYNIIVGGDDVNNDGSFDDRPSYAPAGATAGGNYIQTQFGLLDIAPPNPINPKDPKSGERIIPANLGTGPAFVADNIRIAKTIGFGPPAGDAQNSQKQRGQNNPSGQMGAFGRPMGGGRGGPFGPTANTGRKYSLTISAQALNAFNDINAGTPSGTLTAGKVAGEPNPLFGQSTTLATSFGSNNVAARRIMLQAVLNF
jgi:hypothetical protein